MSILHLPSEEGGGLKGLARLGDVPCPPLGVAQREEQVEALRSCVPSGLGELDSPSERIVASSYPN